MAGGVARMNYTRIDKAKLLHIDCMTFMATLPDKAFDLAIVDPPYAWNSGNAFTSRLKKYGDLSFNEHRPTSEYFSQLKRVSSNQVVWGGNYFISDLHDTKCMIFWHKHQPVETYADGEIAWTSFVDKHCAIYDYKYFGAINREIDRFHPTQKPVKLYEWLLTNYAKPGQRILDTHLGSGSSAIACNNLRFELVGCELDEDYYRAAVSRVEQASKQIRMFA
jgi:site-specific DNA-methyltransferase (adenine-specific)